MKKIKIYFPVLLLLFFLMSCTSDQLEARFRERVMLGNGSATLYKYGTRQFEEGTIVVYTGDDAGEGRDDFTQLGYAVFRRGLGGWRNGQSGSNSRSVDSLSNKLVDFGMRDISYTPTDEVLMFQYQLLFGEILSSTVEAVEVTLGDGTILRDEGQNEVFAFQATQSQLFCEMRLLGDNGKLLETVSIQLGEEDKAEIDQCTAPP